MSLLLSTSVVALAEIGDKTQLLSFMLAAKFRRPLPIVLGILAATLLNHGAAGALGTWLNSLLSPGTLRWVLGVSFLAMAGWMLIPDKLSEEDAKLPRYGVFAATFVAFFFAEMGDKTQFATIGLAAQYQDFWTVVVGTTAGMMLANVPAVYLGDRFAHRMPVRAIHVVASLMFAVLGVATLLGAGSLLGI